MEKTMTGQQQLSIEDLHHRLLFKQYEPASVIINENHEVLHTTSDIDCFLNYSGEEPSQRILEMVVPEFRKVLSRLLFQVKQSKNALSSKKVRLNRNGASGFCKMMVREIAEPTAPEGLIHVIFMEISDAAGDYLQASNEELQPMNEELISTTEQLEASKKEASKKELQSVNEELKCANAELEHKIEKLDQANYRLKNEVELSTRLQKKILSNSLEERWKLGAYLHDNLAQILVSVKILVNEIKDKLAGTAQADISSILASINNLIDTQIDNIGTISHDIIPIDVEEGGVSHAFNLLMRRSQEIHEVKCTLETNRILNQITNRELATNLYHIAQEAIKNAAVHGEAERISVVVSVQEGQLQLEINDDGKGFSSAEKSSEGMGLRIMRHRMELLGGTFTVKSLPHPENFTTSIRCTIPMKAITSSSEEREPRSLSNLA